MPGLMVVTVVVVLVVVVGLGMHCKKEVQSPFESTQGRSSKQSRLDVFDVGALHC